MRIYVLFSRDSITLHEEIENLEETSTASINSKNWSSNENVDIPNIEIKNKVDDFLFDENEEFQSLENKNLWAYWSILYGLFLIMLGFLLQMISLNANEIIKSQLSMFYLLSLSSTSLISQWTYWFQTLFGKLCNERTLKTDENISLKYLQISKKISRI